ncbi:hypothetical protein BgiBS90_034970 [Biomphalaria glabrata]|nr:hypothetical protein BgiBS90_034970 [Biomphalaria glabrata]
MNKQTRDYSPAYTSEVYALTNYQIICTEELTVNTDICKDTTSSKAEVVITANIDICEDTTLSKAEVVITANTDICEDTTLSKAEVVIKANTAICKGTTSSKVEVDYQLKQIFEIQIQKL